jgi:uncharacterized Ntn-hydrolase superfamily protein
MTFSIAARCARTGMFGIAITTSSIAVGSRCAYARSKVGAVLTQHRTDPRLGPLGIELLAGGKTAAETVAAMAASTEHARWRQLAAVDAHGHTAHFSGEAIISHHGGATAKDCVAIGNVLRSPRIPEAMVWSFNESDTEQPLATRLLRALAAGDAAGGEVKPLLSAALLVVHDQSFPYIDLRVDSAADPIGALTTLWHEYEKEADLIVTRALDPDSAGPATPPPS